MASPAKKKKKFSSADHFLISSISENQQQSLSGSSFETAFREEQKQKMEKRILKRKIWICNDVWMDIFPLFRRPQLGLKLARLSPHFNALVDAHFDRRELKIWREIKIHKDVGPTPKLLVGFECAQFPFPECPLPNKIRFKNLQIRYIDHSVLTFLRSNQHFWDRGMSLRLYVPASDKGNDEQPIWDVFTQEAWDVFAREIWPIFAPNIRHFTFKDGDHFDNLRRLISPTILTDCHQLNSINSNYLLPDLNANDGPNLNAGQALSKWLHTPRTDGQPKRLRCYEELNGPSNIDWVNSFKEAFLGATTTTTNSPVNYCICFEMDVPNSTPIVPFELVNERTNEKMTLEKEDGNESCGDVLVLKRCPIFWGTADDQWKDEYSYANVDILLCAKNHCIGPLFPPDQTSNSAELNYN